MRKPVLVVALSVAVTLLLLGMRVAVDGGSRPVEAGAAAQPNANATLVGSTQSWKVASKGTFPFDRMIVKVVTGGPTGGKVAKAVFKCQATGEEVTSVAPKGVESKTDASGVVSYNEVWSANFATKCVDSTTNVLGAVNVTLEPVDPTNKLVIKQALVQNTHTLVPQESAVNFARILNGPPSAWKITIKDSTKGYNRVDLVVTTARTRTPRFALFFCSSSHELAFGTFKQQLPTANQELWSVNFRRKCSNSVLVLFLGFDRRNQPVIKSGRATNTTHLVPVESSANATLKAKTLTFKLRSKAIFDADRVDVAVGTAQNTPKVRSAVFVCHNQGLPDEKVIGISKGIVKNANPVGDSLPNHEIWSAEFSHKCILAHGSVTVILSPLDPNDQLVIKAAFVENTTPPTSTRTPSVTPTATRTPSATPPPSTQGVCVAGDQGVQLPHRPDQPLWDVWKCTPDHNIDWNRVDIYVGRPDTLPNAEKKLKAVQFDCQSGDSKASTTTNKGVFGGFLGTAQNIEIWSGSNFKTDPDGPGPLPAVLKNCHGGVTVLLAMFDPNNHPAIKKATFSHTGAPKVPPPKLDSNGTCEPTTLANVYHCGPASSGLLYNRVDVKVSSPSANTLVLSGAQITTSNGCTAELGASLKGQKTSHTAQGTTFHEVWSFDLPHKCSLSVLIHLVPFDPNAVAQIIGINFSNPPKKPAANGTCTLVDNIHQWSCLPDTSVSQFSRIDVSVGKAQLDRPKLTGAFFVCVATGEVATARFKLQKPNETGGDFSLSDVWSADFSLGPCTGEVRVFLIEVDPNNLPVIKKVVFAAPAT